VSYLDATSTSTTKAAPADRYTETKARVLSLVRTEGTFRGGVNVLRARLGAKKEDVCAAVEELEAAGAIQRDGPKNKPTLVAVGTTPHDE
jgi:hypothetical protein